MWFDYDNEKNAMTNVDPETGIWSMKIARKRHKTDYMLAAAIGCMYSPKRVADVGCGPGYYCRIFKAYGWPIVHGFEGTAGIEGLGIYNSIFMVDLTKEITGFEPYDLVICLEVGEHIPPQHEDMLINNICKLAYKDLILSWAPLGQYSASGHVNCRPRSYVINKFGMGGFRYLEDKTWILQHRADFSWFKKNIMVFERLLI